MAGTPLGDPIEVSALRQALSHLPGMPSQRPPVTLASVKACYGHTEGAAGITGVLLAAQALHIRASPPIMHLRTVNPFVEAAFSDWSRSGSSGSSAPRTLQPAVDESAMPRAAGASSFGMSGVNAHVLIAAPPHSSPPVDPREAKAAVQWRRQRAWPVPPLHAALPQVHVRALAAVFAVNVISPRLSALLDHGLHGTSCMPAAAWLDIMQAAGRILSGSNTLLTDCVIGSILQLHAADEAASLTCSVSLSDGVATISSSEGSHLQSLVQCNAPATAAATRHRASSHPSEFAAVLTSLDGCDFWTLANGQLPRRAVAGLAASEASSSDMRAICSLESASCLPLHSVYLDARAAHACAAFAWQPLHADSAPWVACTSTASVDMHSQVSLQSGSRTAMLSGLQHKRVLSVRSGRAASPAMQLLWKPTPLPPQLQPLRPGVNWLLLSSGPCSIQDLVVDALATLPGVVIVRYQRHPHADDGQQQQQQPHIVVHSDAELQAVLSTTQADHAFCIQQPPPAAGVPGMPS